MTEAALVRDILYVFQGIDGKNIKMSSAENRYTVEAKVQEAAPAGPARAAEAEARQAGGSCDGVG